MGVSSVDGQVIPSIMSKVRNLRRLRLIAIYGLRDVARMDYWTRLSTVCAELEIMAGSGGDFLGDSERRCMSAQLGPFLDNRRGVYFPYLTRVTVVGCCLHQATIAYAALIPANFPVLTRLGLLLLPKECDQNPGQIMLRIFKSDWSQLTSLSFVGCFSSKELDFALSATPNVRKLYCNMMTSLLDFEVIRSRLPRLVDLELRSKKNIYSQPKQSSAVTSRIRRVHIQTTIVSIDLLRFIFTALPGLRELFIDNCQIQEDAARYGVRQSAKTPLANLDSVVLSAAVGTPLAEHMVTLIPAFANAAKLCVHASREQKEQICAKYPHITLREKLD
ncbi:hypothetical protein GQ42DRAFT_163895 [Ramicandelaber brevisporus]|nr:hypothetical protein GQ42DRAFT_163895 [Ramicandelaber brevisporus]